MLSSHRTDFRNLYIRETCVRGRLYKDEAGGAGMHQKDRKARSIDGVMSEMKNRAETAVDLESVFGSREKYLYAR